LLVSGSSRTGQSRNLAAKNFCLDMPWVALMAGWGELRQPLHEKLDVEGCGKFPLILAQRVVEYLGPVDSR
jgi:hypothetical protein